jgi:hypothetical protein
MHSCVVLVRGLTALALVASLTACSGYLDHNDTVSAAAGDAVAANAAIQTVDPWPRASERTVIMTDGRTVKTTRVDPGVAVTTPAAEQQAADPSAVKPSN